MTERDEIIKEASAPALQHEGSYVDWSSILAGAVVASGIAFVFTTFGAAVGLTMASPYDGEGSAVASLIAIGSWMLWTTVSSFMVGGYIAGRMRRRIDQVSADEVSIRDGIHGLAVWGVAILLGAVLLSATIDSVAEVSSETATTVASTMDDSTESEAVESTDDGEAASEQGVSVADAKAAAETARKYSVISAFALAASLLIAAASAYWAAGVGGQHRDEGRVFARFGRWT